MKEKLRRNLGVGIIAFHLIGVAGTLYDPFSALTISLTPFNLLLSAALIVYTHPIRNKEFFIFLALACCIGYLVEVAGVATGFIFGDYTYGPTLGWTLLDVPPLIGVNWFILSYCFAELVNRLKVPAALQILLATVCMVALDMLIEPVAVKLHYWQWADQSIPLRNFVGWFVVALGIQTLASRMLGDYRNHVTIYLIISQILYFTLTLIFY